MDPTLTIAGLAGFSFVSAVTPGPNNVLLWASGMRFGLRRSIPHVIGTALGIGGLAIAVGIGLGAVLAAAPGLTVAMRFAGSIYLVWLAWRIARSGEIGEADLDHPMSLGAATLFQVVNPKAWFFALGALSTFHPSGDAGLAGAIQVALVMMLVVLPAAAIWAGLGGVIGRLVTSPPAHRAINLVLPRSCS